MSKRAIMRLHDLDNDAAVSRRVLADAAVRALFDNPAAKEAIGKEVAVRVAAAYLDADDDDESELTRLRDIVGAESVDAILAMWRQIDPELFSEEANR
jgi:hypothetical protein